MNFNISPAEIIEMAAGAGLLILFLIRRFAPKKPPKIEYDKNGKPIPSKPELPFEAKFELFLRRKAVSLITLALISNTFLAQLYVRSNGIIIFAAIRPYYIVASAIGSTLAFSIFEILQVRTLNEMMNDELTHSRKEWFKNVGASIFTSAYNLYTIAIMDYALSPSYHKALTTVPTYQEVTPTEWGIAVSFTAILLLVSLVGDKKESAEQEVKRLQDETQRQLLTIARLELTGIIEGTSTPSKTFVALSVIGSDVSRVFFANFVAAMDGTLTMEDVLANTKLTGVITPGSAKKNALPAPAQTDENTPQLDDEKNESQATVEASSSQMPSVEEVLPNAAEFERFILEGVTLTDELPLSTMAKRLGIPPSTLYKLWKELELPSTRGANNANLIAVYQVLALVNRNLLPLPDNVKVKDQQPELVM